ncbi:hypothetical protein EV424DRAFT_1438318 [Suillus variegatus]|nr:hypothetical protein EV424DRAFT_1438318 [Suillus variegatus]
MFRAIWLAFSATIAMSIRLSTAPRKLALNNQPDCFCIAILGLVLLRALSKSSTPASFLTSACSSQGIRASICLKCLLSADVSVQSGPRPLCRE